MSGNGHDEDEDAKRDEPEASAEAGLEATPQDEREALRRELAELKEQLLRRRADFENYKKRMERDRENAGHARRRRSSPSSSPPSTTSSAR